MGLIYKSLLIFLFVAGIARPVVTAEQAKQSYHFGVFPYLSAVRLEGIYAPLSAHLNEQLAAQVHFRTASRFDLFFKRLQQAHYDFALIQPFWYPPAVDQFGYQPLVRMQEPFTALILTLDSGPYKKVDDLKGTTVATPPAFVPVVHMARNSLKEIGMTPGQNLQFKAFKSVDSCLQQVLIGAASACVAPPFAPAIFEEKMQIRLRVLLQSPAIPNLSFVVHSRVPLQTKQQLKDLLLSLHETPSGQRLLRSMKTRRFVPAIDQEYNVVRDLLSEIKRQ